MATLATQEFPNGVYQGDLLDGQKVGKGVFFWDTGEFYVGKTGYPQ